MSDQFIVPQSITEEVTRFLRRQLLLRKKYPPGSFIRENEVAEELNVSRSPVREALKVLESYGIIKTLPRRGALVLRFSKEELDEIYDVRVLLETKVYTEIVKNSLMTQEHEAYLGDCIREYREIRRIFEKKGLEEGQLAFFELERRFHFYIHNISGLTWTSELLRKAYSRVFQCLIHNVMPEDLDSLADFHQEILHNLHEGNLEALCGQRVESYMNGKAYENGE